MIDYLRGKLVTAGPDMVIMEVGGVGLQVIVPSCPGFARETAGGEITLYTRLFLREAEAILYGFRSPLERNLFNLVIGISGFGPRLGLALLSVFTPPQLYLAVLGEDIASLRRAPGVGHKTAQRLVLELKGKMPALMGPEAAIVATAGGAIGTEVVEALHALGYSRPEALSAVNRIEPGDRDGLTREELLKMALQGMAGRLPGGGCVGEEK